MLSKILAVRSKPTSLVLTMTSLPLPKMNDNLSNVCSGLRKDSLDNVEVRVLPAATAVGVCIGREACEAIE